MAIPNVNRGKQKCRGAPGRERNRKGRRLSRMECLVAVSDRADELQAVAVAFVLAGTGALGWSRLAPVAGRAFGNLVLRSNCLLEAGKNAKGALRPEKGRDGEDEPCAANHTLSITGSIPGAVNGLPPVPLDTHRGYR